jgi:hypothetical protein
MHHPLAIVILNLGQLTHEVPFTGEKIIKNYTIFPIYSKKLQVIYTVGKKKLKSKLNIGTHKIVEIEILSNSRVLFNT